MVKTKDGDDKAMVIFQLYNVWTEAKAVNDLGYYD